MKTFYRMSHLMAALFIGAATLSEAQAPQGVSYQAVIRDGSGVIMNNQAVTMRFTIHQNTSSGTTVYQETHAVSTNAYGLVTAVLGGGSVVTGTFNTIDWLGDDYYLQVEVDPGS